MNWTHNHRKASTLVQGLRERLRERTQRCEKLEEATMWERHGPVIWEATQFIGRPVFYPVYRWGNYYSYSLLALILRKGSLSLNPEVKTRTSSRNFYYLPAQIPVDTEIEKVGGPHACERSIRDTEEYAQRLATAMVADAERIQDLHPGYQHAVLCGGKDSLNLLLLPWRKPPLALSAEPNYTNAVEFVEANGLDATVVRLEDSLDPGEGRRELLESCCRVDLANWRWAPHLRRIAAEHGGEIVFWKGQMADLYTTPKWRTYFAETPRIEQFARKTWGRLPNTMAGVLDRVFGHSTQSRIVDYTWSKGSVLQGAHNAFIREITDSLVLSGYHGRAAVEVIAAADLTKVAQTDMRHLIGRHLLGREVTYMATNPAPPVSTYRIGLTDCDTFVSELSAAGVAIR